MNDYKVSAEDFIKAWQSLDSLAEVSERLGIPLTSCSSRAQKYRAKGIPLKKHSSGPRKPLDVAALKQLVNNIKKGDRETVCEKKTKVILDCEVYYSHSGDLLRQILGD